MTSDDQPVADRPGSPASGPGALIGAGRAADVFALDGGLVLRRYRTAHDSAPEAAIMRHLHAHGYPVPRVERAEGPDLVMERIDGPTMLADLSAHPWRLRRHARTLADLHRRLAAIPAPDDPSGDLPGDGPGIVHLDLHPDNVLIGPRGPVVIDWSNARRGDPADELPNTWLLLATGDLPNAGLQRLVATLGRRAFIAAFLHGTDRTAIARRLPALGERRTVDPNVPPAEADRVRAFVDRETHRAT